MTLSEHHAFCFNSTVIPLSYLQVAAHGPVLTLLMFPLEAVLVMLTGTWSGTCCGACRVYVHTLHVYFFEERVYATYVQQHSKIYIPNLLTMIAAYAITHS